MVGLLANEELPTEEKREREEVRRFGVAPNSRRKALLAMILLETALDGNRTNLPKR